ncbi:MAG: LUD domain-containing protein [Chloroflexi bacterium]|nr:LUD domain-containing protein [Chloroflexota bacterium]
MTVEVLAPASKFSLLPSDEQIEQTAQALEANGIHTLIAEDADEARKLFFKLFPDGAQIHQGSSLTLDALGITSEIEKSGRFDAIRPVLRSMDRATQGDQIRRLGASPDFMAGSVQAVTEDGRVLAVSATGSQLGPYVSGAGKVVWVVGVQKIVKDLDEGMRRVEEHVVPLENERMQKAYGMNSSLNKMLIINKERPGRITMILVKDNLGF